MARSASPLLPLLALFLPQALLGLAGGAPAWANDPDYPSREELRQLQLDTIACGRDNRPPECDSARASADPLLDHPRLSGNCKDALWQIGQDAVVVPDNSFERREGLTTLAGDVVRFCRPLDQPLRPSGDSAPAARPPSGSGFGFIR